MALLMPKTLKLSDGERHQLHPVEQETQHAATDRATSQNHSHGI